MRLTKGFVHDLKRQGLNCDELLLQIKISIGFNLLN